MSSLYDIETAAKRLDLSPQQLRNLCRNNKIKAERVANTWVLREEDIEYYYDNNSCGMISDQFTTLTRDRIINHKPIALSFFSGAMGLDIGLEQAGFNILLASEIDNACRKTIRKNKPEIALIGDIRNYSPEDIRAFAGLTTNDEIDLIVGGPPCQAFSTAGKRKAFEDERGNVFLTYLNIIISLRPKYAVIENVRGLLSAPLKHRPHKERIKGPSKLGPEERPGGALFHILNTLKQNGYSVSFNLYNAANFGTPQKRERVVLICSRDSIKAPYLVPTHSEFGDYGLPKWRTLREAIGSIQGSTMNYINFPEKRLKYYRLLKAGQNWRDLPEGLQKEALGASYYAGGGRTGFLRRLSWDEPSPTLVTHPAMPATDLAHPEENRPLSIEEYKKIQEFPDEWKIEGSIIEQYKQIGNAVPISLGKAIGNLIINLLNNERVPSFYGFQYSRYKNTDDESWMGLFLQENGNPDLLQLFAY